MRKRNFAGAALALTAVFTLGAVCHAQAPDLPEPYRGAVDKLVERAERGVAAGPYKADFEDLGRVTEAPEWFMDDKYGIYFHWGVYCVPAHGNEWYPRNMHKGRDYAHHKSTYGEPDRYPYTKFVPQFTAEHFDAEEWADLFHKAGARYAGPVAEHHDGFAMWDSAVTPWNAADAGPKRDLTGELAKAIRAKGMKFVATFHHARNPGHYSGVYEHYPTLLEDPINAIMYGHMPRDRFEQFWLAKLVEVIDQYEPDLIWFDSWLHEISEERRAQFAAYYFNQADKWGKDVVITRKQNDLPISFSLEDFEKGRANKMTPNWWLTDDTISTGSWCFTSSLGIKPTQRVLHDFIDIVSKRGCLLLNISPKKDGTIPDNQRKVLLEVGAWLKVNGEAIYDTRPWKIFGEGPTRMSKGGHFVRGVTYGAEDIRFTQSKDGATVYAVTLGWSDEDLAFRSLQVDGVEDDATVELLGHSGRLEFAVDDEAKLTVALPKLVETERPGEHAFAFKLTGFDLSVREGFDPNAPPPPKVSKDLILDAGEATTTGNLATESKYDGVNLGYWDSPGDVAAWKVKISKAGEYDLTADIACVNASKLRVEVGDQSMTAEIPATGGWAAKKTVSLGRVKVAATGEITVLAKPADPSAWNAINLWQIELTSVE